MSKILLVEDDPMNVDMLSRRLMKRGYEVVWLTAKKVSHWYGRRFLIFA